MSTVNLLPPEIRERQRTKRRTALVGLIGAAVLALVGGFYFVQLQRLADANEELEAQQAANGGLQTQIAELQEFERLRLEREEREALVESIVADEVAWSGVLRDLSRVIPNKAWLTDMSGTLAVAQGAEAPEEPSPGGLIGNITFSGNALSTDTIAAWLNRLEQVKGWENSWYSSASKSDVGGTTVYTFSSTVDLSREAVERRQEEQA